MNEIGTKIDVNSELIPVFARKGFLLDKESLDFFANLNDIKVATEALDKIAILIKARIISKKTLNAHFKEIKMLFNGLDKTAIIQDFFSEAISEKPAPPKEIVVKPQIPEVKIISSEIIPYRRIEVKDFVTHFKNRYNFFKEILKERKELENLVSINKIGNNRTFSLIGIVANKKITKNKNILIELEDLTGKRSILVTQSKEAVMEQAKDVLLDEIIGIKCSGGRDFIYANEIIFAECKSLEKKKAENEGYALFISDVHTGSKLFLEENFNRFLDWINGKDADEAMKDKLRKIKYLFMVGDNIDGVGIYPGQESLLAIKDVSSQYEKLASMLERIPKHIKIIICPGQHDAVRVPEPQPAIDAEFAKRLTEMSNVLLVSNPAIVEIEATEKKSGFTVLMYHGASMHSLVDEIESLRTGQAHLNPSKIVKQILKHRHLSPIHSGNVYIPDEKEDHLAILKIPDIMVTGDLHRTDIEISNNILIICCSCWQSITPFEEKVGNQPDPCKVPMLNLKTREIKIMDFS